MTGKSSKKGKVDNNQAMWVKLPRTEQIERTLDKNGVVHVRGENPDFSGAPYCVLLGLRIHKSGPIRYGILDSHREGDYFYAEVQDKGVFDIHLKAQNLRNKKVTIVWCAIPESKTCYIGPTTTPMPIPRTKSPTQSPTTVTSIRSFKSVDASGRYVNEVRGIGPKGARRLTKGGIGSLAALASAVATDVAQVLSISEVKAMGFIDKAGRLLQSE